MRTVSRYGTGGWLEDLPRMNLGRADHGCASFVQEGDKVSAAPPHRLSCVARRRGGGAKKTTCAIVHEERATP